MSGKVDNDSIRTYFNSVSVKKIQSQSQKGKIGPLLQSMLNGQAKPAGKVDPKVANTVNAYTSLSPQEREQYSHLQHMANSKSYGIVADQVKEWNAKHPDLKIVSQYNIE